MSNLNTTKERILNTWRILRRQWHTTSEQWKDSVQQHFEREIWTNFERTVPSVLEALENLDAVIDQARREVP